jgi:hypothetical protein
MMSKSVKIYAFNFWRGFSMESGFVPYLLRRALGPFDLARTEHEADIVLVSVFPRFQRLRGILPAIVRETPKFPEKSIGLLWENQRPDYRKYAYSLSSDFDSYGGRNARVPVWYAQIKWPDRLDTAASKDAKVWDGFEPLVSVESLMMPRKPSPPEQRKRFCCFVAANREPHRVLAAQALERVSEVDLYGPIAGKPFRGSKYDLLRDYKFNLCFENSTFPGYYTEKMLQAWVGGCIPLYYSDPWFHVDFNRKAALNRIDCSSLEEFASQVAALNRSPDAFAEMFSEPLLTREPRIEPVLRFLGEACTAILEKRT